MKPVHFAFLIFGLFPACSVVSPLLSNEATPTDGQTSSELVRPQARPEGLTVGTAPPAGARTAEAFDTTTQADRAAASAVPAAPTERRLGTTVASLGAPTEPGFWLKTPLVTREIQGRVVYPETGKSVQVTLIPIDAPPTAGSRMSLAALRLIEAPLAGLPEVQVFAGS